MKPAIYGVGVGPGDPRLLTLQAIEVLQSCRVVMAPAPRRGAESLALKIAATHLGEDCHVVTAHLPMSEDRATVEPFWEAAAKTLLHAAEEEPPVAFITLGDALFYSTWSYLLAAVRRLSPDTAVETVPGVTAMAACASVLGWPLAEGRDPLLVWPDAPPADPGAILDLAPNVVFMKAGRHLSALADLADRPGVEAVAIRRASQSSAETTTDLRSWVGSKEYFTTVLVHREENT